MKVNRDAKGWIKSKPISYVTTLKREEFLSMDLGECFLGKSRPPLPKLSRSQLSHYPYGQESLKKMIAEKFCIKTNTITLGNGSDEIIEHIPQVFLNRGDNVLIVVPTFFRFIDSSFKKGAKIHFVATKKEDNFAVTEKTVETILKIAKEQKVKIIWICSPNNPTGIPIKKMFIEKIISQTTALVILDQVYEELQNDEVHINISLIKEHKNVIILKSFSKVFGLAGIRVGFAMGHEKVIHLLNTWKLPFNISGYSLAIAEEILKDNNIVIHTKKAVDEERNFLFKEIKKLKNLDVVENSETNIFLLRHKTKDLFKELLKQKILVANLEKSPGLDNMSFVRVTIGKHKENIAFLKALKDIN